MKYFSLLLLPGALVLLPSTAAAQLQTGFHYKIKNDKGPLLEYVAKEAGKPVSPKTIYPAFLKYKNGNAIPLRFGKVWRYIARGGRVTALKAGITQTGDSLLVNFWPITGDTELAIQPTYVNSTDVLGTVKTGGYYYIQIPVRTKMSDHDLFFSIPYSTWEAGLLTVPFKYRFGHRSATVANQLSSGINAGVYVGRKWGRTRFFADTGRKSNSWAFMLAGVFTPTVIAIDSTNTDKQVKITSSELGMSLGGAALLSFKDLNVGVVGGWDLPVTGESDKWIYANKFWLGFGIGYTLGGFGPK